MADRTARSSARVASISSRRVAMAKRCHAGCSAEDGGSTGSVVDEMGTPTVPVRVLLVDDDERFAEVVSEMLADSGYDVIEVVGSAGAVPAACDRVDPDVVVVDLVLPDGDGIEVADRIRDDGSEVPILVFSSLFDQRVGQAVLDEGYGWVEKAAGLEALELAIDASVQLERVIDLRGAPAKR